MFVDPTSRALVANQADANHILKPYGSVFVGTFPPDQTVANTAVAWSGLNWTQMLWPLPANKLQRDTLIAHELFHRIQGELNLPNVRGGENPQLDTLEGRYYLQLEWRALTAALQARPEHGNQTQEDAIRDALLFRAERYSLFPEAARQEQSLELNEGLAEYTGIRIGNPTHEDQVKAALYDLATHTNDSTFVRSFAYATGPAYGLLLDTYLPGWHDQLKTGKAFDTLLQQALSIEIPADPHAAAEQQAQLYSGPTLRAAEMVHESTRQQILFAYRSKFVDGPTLSLKFKNMHLQLDPSNLQPLGDAGTVYPNLRIYDEWGILDAKNGALMRPDWSGVIVAAPNASAGTSLKGDGWTLELKPGWKVVAGSRKGDFILTSGS
jgi:hypothetical protein